MPKVNWGISAKDIDNFDRDAQYKPYDGPIPPNGVYQFKIKVLKSVAGTREKNPQLRIGLELKPRSGRSEKSYTGYFIMTFPPVTDKTQFRYVPFLDAIGVSGRDFETRTIADQEGNIKSIGQWRNDGEEIILAELKDGVDQHGAPRKEIGWMGPLNEDDSEEESEDTEDEEYYDDEENADYDEDDAF